MTRVPSGTTLVVQSWKVTANNESQRSGVGGGVRAYIKTKQKAVQHVQENKKKSKKIKKSKRKNEKRMLKLFPAPIHSMFRKD